MAHLTQVSYRIPYTCQFASPDYVDDFVNGRRALQSDANWADYGAASPDEYAHWALRSCGMVCIKMLVEGLGSPAQSVMDWVRVGLAIDGYLTEQRAERPVEKGWKHNALATLVQQQGHYAQLMSGLGIANLVALLRSDRCFVASVSSEIGEDSTVPITRNNGHLVVVYGFAQDDAGNLTHIVLHNPSGRTPLLRAGAQVPVERFQQAFSGRGIAIGPT